MMKIIVVMFNGLVEEEKTWMIKIIHILLSINQNDKGDWYYWESLHYIRPLIITPKTLFLITNCWLLYITYKQCDLSESRATRVHTILSTGCVKF
jgi:hypothetical protein